MQQLKRSSSTTLHNNRKIRKQQQEKEQTANHQPLKKPSTSLLKNRSQSSSFKITVTRNHGNSSKQIQSARLKPQIQIALRKKQTSGHDSIKKDKGSMNNSRPNSPLKSRNIQNLDKEMAPGPLAINLSSKSIPEQIMDYIEKREDVDIVENFQEYKKQFYTKSKVLQNFIYQSKQPQKIRNTYLNEHDAHFRNGLEANMLKLFRSGVIVPYSYTNLRQEAVDQIEKWVIGWIHRKISYGQLVEQEEAQTAVVEEVVRDLEDYKRMIDSQDTSF